MATFATIKEAGRPQDFLDDSWLECSICLEALTRNHRVLPCQHTFCLPCLEDLTSSTKTKNKAIANNETDEDGTKDQNKGFLCPECRASVNTSLDKLPSNVILNRILEGRNKGIIKATNKDSNTTNASKDIKNKFDKKPIQSTQTEKINSTQCDKYKAFAEAARALNEPTRSKTQCVPTLNNVQSSTSSDKMLRMAQSSCDVMQTDIKPPSIPPPPIPGNLSTNPFVKMVVPEILPSPSKLKSEKENLEEGTTTGLNTMEKEKFKLLSKHNLHNLNNTNASNPGTPTLKVLPTLPPRTLSIVSPIQVATFSASNLKNIQGSPQIQSGTSSMSTSGAEDGSSPESPAPSLPPKPSFSYVNINSKNLESTRKKSTEILGIRSTNIPPPVHPPPPLPMQQKNSLQQQIEKELLTERKLAIPPTRATSGGMPHQVYRALYDYTASRSDELELTKNELYFVFEKCQDGWFKGSGLATLKTGVFPGNYVHPVQVDSNIESQICSSKGPTKSFLKDPSGQPVSTIASQSSTSSKNLIDLSNDIFEQQVGNQNSDTSLEAVTSARGKHTEQHITTSPALYRVMMSYPASSQYELDLQEGDIVILIKKREDGWCKGTVQKNGMTGLFPFSFVEKISN